METFEDLSNGKNMVFNVKKLLNYGTGEGEDRGSPNQWNERQILWI
jgi:hypothetical protein